MTPCGRGLRCEVCGRAIAAERAKGCVPSDCALQRVELLRTKRTLKARVSERLQIAGAIVAVVISTVGVLLAPALFVAGIAFALRAGWLLATWVFR